MPRSCRTDEMMDESEKDGTGTAAAGVAPSATRAARARALTRIAKKRRVGGREGVAR